MKGGICVNLSLGISKGLILRRQGRELVLILGETKLLPAGLKGLCDFTDFNDFLYGTASAEAGFLSCSNHLLLIAL